MWASDTHDAGFTALRPVFCEVPEQTHTYGSELVVAGRHNSLNLVGFNGDQHYKVI